MKIVRINLDPDSRHSLEKLQINGSGLLRERSLAVLHCADGKQISWIAKALNRRPLTIRTWITRYCEHGIAGLNRSFSPGRPSGRQQVLSPKLREYLTRTPRDYGWHEDIWTVNVIIAQFEKDLGRKVGLSTVIRLLKDEGYSFKRPPKTTPLSAPSHEEKLERVKEIARELLELEDDRDVSVVLMNQSHFSTDPYVIRGWHKTGQSLPPTHSASAGKPLGIWRIRTAEWEIVLEKREIKQLR